MEQFLIQNHIAGLIIGLATFIIIGVFHPLVIKGYYHFGLRCRRWFLIAGIITLALCIYTDSLTVSALLGVTSFSCFWSIKEVGEQAERVRRGWFPANPKHQSQQSR